jgi:hypothetical protein
MIDIQLIIDRLVVLFVGVVLSTSVTVSPPNETTGDHPALEPILSIPPTHTPIPTDFVIPIPTSIDDDKPWGQAWRQDDGSYTFKIQEDPMMSEPRELADAINRYRETKGFDRLEWSDALSAYAQTRAEYIAKNGSDHHAGFNNFIQNEDGFNKLGFNCLGENMSEGFRLSGTHLVEWMYAQSPGHDANQLNSIYNRVGVGISEKISVLIFGGCD